MKAIHVVSVPLHLDLTVLDKVLGGIEASLMEPGADRVWIDVEEPDLAVIAQLPDDLVDEMHRDNDALAVVS